METAVLPIKKYSISIERGCINMKALNLKKRILPAILVAAFALAAAGCGKKAPQTVTFTVPSNPTTGYTWEVTQEEELFDVSTEFVQDESKEGMVGVGGTEVITLTPKASGTTKVTLSYAQHWDGGSEDTVVTYEFKVSGSLQVKMESAAGSMAGDMDSVPEMPQPEIK